jgi:hypothetical protein
MAIETFGFLASVLAFARFSRNLFDDMESPIADLMATLSELDLGVLGKF